MASSKRSVPSPSALALSGEIVDFRRLHFLDDANEIGRIRHVTVVQEKPDAGTVRILVQMIDARGVEGGRTAFDAVHDVTLAEQQLSQIRAVLPGRSGNQCNTICHA
jgi:hypothetical protein